MFYLGGVGLAFFLTLLLVSKKQKTTADKILTGWLTLMILHLLIFYFRKAELYPQTLGVEIPLPLIHGPFLYLYTRALTGRPASARMVLLHALPVITILIYVIPFLALPLEQKIFVYKNQGAGYEIFSVVRSIVIMASGIIYVILSSFVLRRHRLSIANQFSNTDRINLAWMQYLIYWIGVIWFLVIFTNDDWVFGAAVLFILFIGFFGIRQTDIFLSAASPEVVRDNDFAKTAGAKARIESTQDNAEEKRKYQKSGLSAGASEALHRQLTQLMTDEKLFRESELSLSDLAARLSTQPNYLSRVINEREMKNFYDYINTLRIEEFKRVATKADSKKYTLLALAEQCGFSSKSSFNRYFKKVTGQSPSEFIDSASVSEK